MQISLKLFIPLLAGLLFKCENAQVDRASLEKTVREINRKCPTLIDSETRLDGIEISKAHAITYKYTLIHLSAHALDTVQFRSAMWPGILSTIRVSPEMQKLRDLKMQINYQYRDAYNNNICTFTITATDYE